MQARYYDPVIGRFYSNDPISITDVHTFNRYAYVANNPYKYTDPTGMSACENSNKTTCIQSDTFSENSSNGQNVVASESVANAMVSGK